MLDIVQEWMLERYEDLRVKVRNGSTEDELWAHLKCAHRPFIIDAATEGYIREVIRDLADEWEIDKASQSPAIFHIRTKGLDAETKWTIEVQPKASPVMTMPTVKPKRDRSRKAKVVKCNFRLIQDGRLAFEDRIVFAMAWKWAFCNRNASRTVSLQSYRDATGFALKTIREVLAKLTAWNYIDANQKPLVVPAARKGKYTFANGSRYLGHRKLSWQSGKGVKAQIFAAIVVSNYEDKQFKTWWLCAATGLSRSQVFRHKRSMGAVRSATGAVTSATSFP